MEEGIGRKRSDWRATNEDATTRSNRTPDARRAKSVRQSQYVPINVQIPTAAVASICLLLKGKQASRTTRRLAVGLVACLAFVLLHADLVGRLKALPAQRTLFEEAVGKCGRNAIACAFAPRAIDLFVKRGQCDLHADSPCVVAKRKTRSVNATR